MKIMLDKGAYMPTRAHETDAGLDLYCREDKMLWQGQSVTFDTGVHIELPKGYFGKIGIEAVETVRIQAILYRPKAAVYGIQQHLSIERKL
jgi:dUTP pyrophosphatase